MVGCKVDSYDQNYKTTKGFGKNRYKKHLNGEMWMSSKCRKLRIKRAMSLLPNLAMMSSCAYVRGDTRFGKYFPSPKEFYLKEFGKIKIKTVSRKCNNNMFSFIEELVEADGWEPAGPGKHDIYTNIQSKI